MYLTPGQPNAFQHHFLFFLLILSLPPFCAASYNPGQLPICAQACVAEAFDHCSSCTYGDFTCACGCNTYQPNAEACIRNSCSESIIIPNVNSLSQACSSITSTSSSSKTSTSTTATLVSSPSKTSPILTSATPTSTTATFISSPSKTSSTSPPDPPTSSTATFVSGPSKLLLTSSLAATTSSHSSNQTDSSLPSNSSNTASNVSPSQPHSTIAYPNFGPTTSSFQSLTWPNQYPNSTAVYTPLGTGGNCWNGSASCIPLQATANGAPSAWSVDLLSGFISGVCVILAFIEACVV